MENRELWDEHVKAHEEMLARTSTKAAPWYVVPADHRWFSALAVADLMVRKLRSLGPRYPAVKGEEKKEMAKGRRRLERECAGRLVRRLALRAERRARTHTRDRPHRVLMLSALKRGEARDLSRKACDCPPNLRGAREHQLTRALFSSAPVIAPLL